MINQFTKKSKLEKHLKQDVAFESFLLLMREHRVGLATDEIGPVVDPRQGWSFAAAGSLRRRRHVHVVAGTR